GHTVTVIDPSPDSLAAAQRRAAEMRVQLRAVQGDVGDLAAVIGDQGADLVLCHSVLEYVDSPEAAMTTVASVLRPGGGPGERPRRRPGGPGRRPTRGRAAPVHPGRGDRPDRSGRAAPRRRARH